MQVVCISWKFLASSLPGICKFLASSLISKFLASSLQVFCIVSGVWWFDVILEVHATNDGKSFRKSFKMMVEGSENRANIMKNMTRGTGDVSDARLFQERVFGAYPDRDFQCFGATWLIGF